jgi:hypothetical protein
MLLLLLLLPRWCSKLVPGLSAQAVAAAVHCSKQLLLLLHTCGLGMALPLS